MPLAEYEAVSRTAVESSCRADAAEPRRPAPGGDPVELGRELERLRRVAAEFEKRLVASERRVAELEALCRARHVGLQIVLAQLHDAEQGATDSRRVRPARAAELAEAADGAQRPSARSGGRRRPTLVRWIAGWGPARRARL